eukprot:PhF_6_TR3471/c0_g1_i1/m.5084
MPPRQPTPAKPKVGFLQRFIRLQLSVAITVAVGYFLYLLVSSTGNTCLKNTTNPSVVASSQLCPFVKTNAAWWKQWASSQAPAVNLPPGGVAIERTLVGGVLPPVLVFYIVSLWVFGFSSRLTEDFALTASTLLLLTPYLQGPIFDCPKTALLGQVIASTLLVKRGAVGYGIVPLAIRVIAVLALTWALLESISAVYPSSVKEVSRYTTTASVFAQNVLVAGRTRLNELGAYIMNLLGA